jgi:hypothetical protein
MRCLGALVLIVVVAFVTGCGGSSQTESTPTIKEADRQATRSRSQPESPAKAMATEGHSGVTPKPSPGANAKQDTHGADKQEAGEASKPALQHAGRHLSEQELQEIAEESIARTERLLHPPKGKTTAEVLREVEEELKAGVP